MSINCLNEEENRFLLAAIASGCIDGLEFVHEVNDLDFITKEGLDKVFLYIDEILVRRFKPGTLEIYSSIKKKLISAA